MNIILKDFIGNFVEVLMDDIIIWSKTLKAHFEHIEEVLKRLDAANLSISLKKSKFAERTVDYLGHVLSPMGLQKQPSKVKAIQEFPIPTCVRDIQRFHGMCQ